MNALAVVLAAFVLGAVGPAAGIAAPADPGPPPSPPASPPAPPPPSPPASAGDPAQMVAGTPAPPAARRAAVSLQAGWWSAEAEWRTASGLYAAASVPWAAAGLYLMSGASWVVPLGARVGYDFALSPRWSLRASAHAAGAYGNDQSKCGCGEDEPTFRLFAFAEAGIRYRAPGGLVFGVDVPLYGFNVSGDQFPPPVSLAFSQLYVGYSWDR